jgi:thiamine monophosphate kinase
MVDISDGIGIDAGRIAARSGCEVSIAVDDLPIAAGVENVADLPFWTMGEDYELLAALDPKDAETSGFFIVGECGAAMAGGGRDPEELGGWDSFAYPGG